MRLGKFTDIVFENTVMPGLTWLLHRAVISFLIVFSVSTLYAQTPEQIAFQGIARDATNKIISNTLINIDVQILSGSPDGQLAFQELHSSKTNQNGVFNIIIGSLNQDPNYNLRLIKWESNKYFLHLFLDPGDGNYVDLGTTQLLPVPYAFFAERVNKAVSADNWTQDKPIIQTGTVNAQSLPAIGIGNKLIWYPKKAAFRVGQVTSTQWEDSEIGNNSFAAGLDVKASGLQSIALGTSLVSKTNHGIALGIFNNDSNNPGGSDFERILQVGTGTAENNRLNALTIIRNGRVGIGNYAVNPSYLLDVGGRARIQHRQNETAGINFNSSTNAVAGFVGMKTDTEVGFFIGGNWRFWVNSQGNGFLNGNIIQTSDRRLKRDFSPLDNSLSRLSNIVGQHYFWKDSTKSQELQTGLIAQEVEEYFPELVSTDEKGFKSVNYIGLIPHLIEAVKTLKASQVEVGLLQFELEKYKNVQLQINELRAELSKQAAINQNQQSK